MRVKTADLRRILRELARRGFEQRTLVDLWLELCLDWQSATVRMPDDTPPPPDPEPEPDETWTFTVDIDIEATSSTGKTRRWSGEIKEVQ